MRGTLFALALGIIAAVGVVVLGRSPRIPPVAGGAHSAPAPGAASDVPAQEEPTLPTAVDPGRGLAVQADLNAASPSFRNTTLLIAIRDGGYVCGDLRDVVQVGDALAGWRVQCSDHLGYWVAVDRGGEFLVSPSPQVDSMTPTLPVREPSTPADRGPFDAPLNVPQPLPRER